jgi:hypothetical protein
MGIFWIASYPKSGNTWVRSFIANVISERRPVPLNKLGAFCASEATASWYKPYGDVETLDARPSKENMELRQMVQERAAVNAAPRDILLKTHNLHADYLGLPLVREDLTVGGVYMLRDPRDVAVSLAAHSGSSLDEAIALMKKPKAAIGPNGPMRGRQMFEIVGDWSSHVSSWTSKWHPRITVFRYEDCLADPEGTLGKLPPFLGISKDIWRIKAALAASSFESLKQIEAEQGFNEKSAHTDSFFARGAAGGWREVLSDAQARKIERDHRKVMTRFGYL